MRDTIRAAILLAVLPISATAFAQQQTADSADEYVCVFSGACGGGAGADAEDVTQDIPGGVKGFSLAPVNTPATSARKPAATAKPGPASRAPVRMANQGTSPSAVKPRAVKASAGRQEARADLRLTFEKGSAILTGDSRRKAMVFAEALRRPELVGRRFVIEGHTDSEGGRAYNLDLSERRARAVADFLVSQGVASDRLEVHGFAFDRPLNGYTAAAHQNRRVEAVLIS